MTASIPVKKARQRFADHEKKALSELGVTAPQVARLERKLPSIGLCLRPSPKADDVRKILIEANEHATALARIAALADAGAKESYRLAMAHLQASSGVVKSEPADGSGDGTLPEVPDFPAAARLLKAMTEDALACVKRDQGRGRRDPARAVEWLLAGLNEPTDEASSAFALRVSPVRIASKKNPFVSIAQVVFGAAIGAESDNVRAAVDAWHKLQKSMQSGNENG